MKIAQVAPLIEPVPPTNYGGTERVVGVLTDGLVAAGHDVTLFASGDSRTRARLVPGCPRALRHAGALQDDLAWELMHIQEVVRRAHEFDLVHFHTDLLHHPLVEDLPVPRVTTVHGPRDRSHYHRFHLRFHDPLVSISHHQRASMPHANWLATIHHGLPADEADWSPTPGDHLLFLGRITPEKGVAHAIAIARGAGVPVRLAGPVPPGQEGFFDSVVAPAERDGVAEYVGEVDEHRKRRLLRASLGVLFPVTWPEPFGLVMIEAMACGTPVVGFPYGAVPEVVDHGLTGFVVKSVPEAVAAVRELPRLDRAHIRRTFETRFSAQRMVRDHLSLYGHLLETPEAAVPAATLSVTTAARLPYPET